MVPPATTRAGTSQCDVPYQPQVHGKRASSRRQIFETTLARKNLADDVFDGNILNIDVVYRQFVQQRFANRDDAVALNLELDQTGALLDHVAVFCQVTGPTARMIVAMN